MGTNIEKEKTKVRKEKLAGYFYNISQLTFTGTGVGGFLPLLQGDVGGWKYNSVNFWHSDDFGFRCGCK